MDFGFFALYVASAYGSGLTNTNHIESINHHPEMLLEDVNSAARRWQNANSWLKCC